MSIQLQKTAQSFLTKQNIQKPLLMVSGGVDSMVLLDIIGKILPAEQITVLHINHNTRPESIDDETLVKTVCKKQNISFYSETIETNFTKNQENNWRKERQTRSQNLKTKINADAILTAHHATDLVETMIFRITKGAGPSGMHPFDTSNKPLLPFSKTDIIQYATKNNLSWNEDITNQDSNTDRNKIRNQVLPPLREITPNLEKVFLKSSYLFEELESTIDSMTKSLPQNEVPILIFRGWSKGLQLSWIKNLALGASLAEYEDTQKWLNGNPEGNTYKIINTTKLILTKGVIVIEET